MLFELTKTRSDIPKSASRPVLCLARDRWDDFGFRTQFYGTLHKGALHEPIALGSVKILGPNVSVTADALGDAPFEALPEGFVSLWQAPESYERIRHSLAGDAPDLLERLRDVAHEPERASTLASEPGWLGSVLRFPGAVAAMRRALELFAVSSAAQPALLVTKFELRLRSKDRLLSHSIDFEFDPVNPLGRVFVLAGPNGTGKTRILSALASYASGRQRRDESACPEVETTPYDVKYSVLAISYSAFDRFSRPNRRMADYRYSGLRGDADEPHRVDVDSRIRELAGHLRTATAVRRTRLFNELRAMDIWSDDEPSWDGMALESLVERIKRRSAGHQIVLLVVAHVILWVKKGTLVLFDEPELHLHPTLLSTLLRVLTRILREEDAFCIIATHSPIPVQEVPTQFVRVLDNAESVVRATRIPEQTFGAELGDIVEKVFRFGPESRNFRTELEELQRNKGASYVRKALSQMLSLSARVFLGNEE